MDRGVLPLPFWGFSQIVDPRGCFLNGLSLKIDTWLKSLCGLWGKAPTNFGGRDSRGSDTAMWLPALLTLSRLAAGVGLERCILEEREPSQWWSPLRTNVDTWGSPLCVLCVLSDLEQQVSPELALDWGP